MTVHLVKLCVGADGVEDLAAWQRRLVRERKAAGETARPCHVTRMTPKRETELLDGGSIYWVIKGFILVRQAIVGLEPVLRADGRYCSIELDPELSPVEAQRKPAFQGWRYLAASEAPADIGAHGRRAAPGLPAPLVAELKDLMAW